MSIENNGNKGHSHNGVAAILASISETHKDTDVTLTGCINERLPYIEQIGPNNPECKKLIEKGLSSTSLWTLQPNSAIPSADPDSEDFDRPLDINNPALDRGFQALAAAALNAGDNSLISAADLQYFTNNHGEPLDDTNDLVFNPPSSLKLV